MTALEEKIRAALMKKLRIKEEDVAGTDENSPLFEGSVEEGQPTFHLDSLDSLELVVMIEKEWGIDVPTEDMKKLTTIKNIAIYIEEHKGSK